MMLMLFTEVAVLVSIFNNSKKIWFLNVVYESFGERAQAALLSSFFW